MSITKRELFDAWYSEKQQNKKLNAVVSYVFAKIGLQNNETDSYCKQVKQSARMFVWFLAKKWAQANRTKLVFEATNKYWLDGNFVIPIKPSSASQDDGLLDRPSTSNYGRPSKEFLDKSERAKRKKVAPLLETWSPEELTFAAGTSLYKSGKRNAAGIVKTVDSSPSRAAKMKKKIELFSKSTNTIHK